MEKFGKDENGNVTFKGAMGDSVLEVDEIVKMLNSFNKTCESYEKTIVALGGTLDVTK